MARLLSRPRPPQRFVSPLARTRFVAQRLARGRLWLQCNEVGATSCFNTAPATPARRFHYCASRSRSFSSAALAQDEAAQRWLNRFSFKQPPVSEEGICAGEVGKLPSFTVTPAKTGEQLRAHVARLSARSAAEGNGARRVGRQVLCPRRCSRAHLHPGQPRSIRRALVTFVYDFASLEPMPFYVVARAWVRAAMDDHRNDTKCHHPICRSWSRYQSRFREVHLEFRFVGSANRCSNARSQLRAQAGSHRIGDALPLDPLARPDPEWPRIIELRADTLGTVTLRAHVQRLGKGDAYAADLGWSVTGAGIPAFAKQSYATGAPTTFTSGDSAQCLDVPDAQMLARGSIQSEEANGTSTVTYLRCASDEKVQDAGNRVAHINHRHSPRNDRAALAHAGANSQGPAF